MSTSTIKVTLVPTVGVIGGSMNEILRSAPFGFGVGVTVRVSVGVGVTSGVVVVVGAAVLEGVTV